MNDWEFHFASDTGGLISQRMYSEPEARWKMANLLNCGVQESPLKWGGMTKKECWPERFGVLF